jgi:hypothetical protein
MDLTAQDVRAIVQQHTRLTDEDTAELLAASMAPQGLPRSQHCKAACDLWLGRLRISARYSCNSSTAALSAGCPWVRMMLASELHCMSWISHVDTP